MSRKTQGHRKLQTRDRTRRRAQRRGWMAEALCAFSLRCRGYRILEQRRRSPVGEVDIIARRSGVLAFIEVKARPSYAQAAYAVTKRQQGRLVHAAQFYIARRPALSRLAMRFDVMRVTTPWRPPHHLTDAWRPDAD
ncbi:MAG: YraN family protein [Alphaproteobacteria bacterium]